jgi:hypothetical protein
MRSPPSFAKLKRAIIGGILLAIICSQDGCVSTATTDYAERSSLVVVEVEGAVQMSWQSQTGRSYTILYSDTGDESPDQWKPLPGYTEMPGSGGSMSAKDRLPAGVDRKYRLHSTVK